jgi:hypothetical protein
VSDPLSILGTGIHEQFPELDGVAKVNAACIVSATVILMASTTLSGSVF